MFPQASVWKNYSLHSFAKTNLHLEISSWLCKTIMCDLGALWAKSRGWTFSYMRWFRGSLYRHACSSFRFWVSDNNMGWFHCFLADKEQSFGSWTQTKKNLNDVGELSLVLQWKSFELPICLVIRLPLSIIWSKLRLLDYEPFLLYCFSSFIVSHMKNWIRVSLLGNGAWRRFVFLRPPPLVISLSASMKSDVSPRHPETILSSSHQSMCGT